MSMDTCEPVTVLVKAVPGASRDQIAGRLGDRLKIRISAPPEGGKANKAICALIANRLGIKRSQVTVIAGKSGPEKRIEILGVHADSLATLFEC